MPPKKKASTNDADQLPGPGDPDRKRVLNVLAQRRYRQRRREKIATLEAQANRLTPPESKDSQSPEQDAVHLPARDFTEITPDATLTVEAVGNEILELPNEVGFPAMNLDQSAFDLTMFPDLDLINLPSPLPSPSTTPLTLPPTSSSASASPRNFSFPLTGDANMTVPILASLRAFGQIATTLGVVKHVHDPFYLHTLSPAPHPSLPPNLHPTPAQIMIPHHPLFDTLPWPSVREKLICMFALPSILRPQVARDSEADEETGEFGNGIVQLINDLDDYRFGVRMHGNTTGCGGFNELEEEAWEVGEKFFQNWWWSLDTRTMDITNRRRRERGLGRLRLKNGNT